MRTLSGTRSVTRLALTMAAALLLCAAASLFVLRPLLAQEIPPADVASLRDDVAAGEVDPAFVPANIPFTGVRQVDMSLWGGCLITLAGELYCWGFNDSGQVGDGTTTTRYLPTKVSTSFSDFIDVSRATNHTCAVRSDGTAWCWGMGAIGRLGRGSVADSYLPVLVTGVAGAVDIEAFDNNTCVLLQDKKVKCWGDNADGQIGNLVAPSPALTSYYVVGLNDAVDLAVGYSHVCAVREAGPAVCWGRNDHGQLGSSSNLPQPLPGPVSNFTDFSQISAGNFHTCALRVNGSAYCWGDNSYGQLGDFTNIDRDQPALVTSLTSGVTQIELGNVTSCARSSDGSVRCWGYGETFNLGNGIAQNTTFPVLVPGLGNAVASVTMGNGESCALTFDTSALCWGGPNDYGSLGNGSKGINTFPALLLRPAICYELKLQPSTGGLTPVPDLSRSDGCPDGHFVPNEMVHLSAFPNAGSRVQSWSAGVAGAPGTTLGVLLMPAADTTVSVTYATCRTLTRTHTGNGANPVAIPENSLGCAEGAYASGETIQLTALPNPNQRVKAWSGSTLTPGLAQQANTLIMPNANHAVSVEYETCHTLTLVATGQGDALLYAPAASAGCLASTFAAGEQVTLLANPADGWQVTGWSGTADNDSTAPTNLLTMPAAPALAGVTYALVPGAGEENRVLLPVVVR